MDTSQVKERFMEKVQVTDSCWLWTAAKNESGYGLFFVKQLTTRFAHRISYWLHHGQPVPNHLVLLHACDNPSCVNPAHLKPGTIAENNTDKMLKGRCPSCRGENNSQAKLTAAEVRAIRQSPKSDREVAKEFGISRPHAINIRARRFWEHV